MFKWGRGMILVCGLLFCLPLGAQDFNYPHNFYPPQNEQIPGPPTSALGS